VEASALLRLSDETGDVVDRPRLSVCGRLDKHSRGLLVLTEDGTLARDIIAGDSVAKTYLVEVARAVTRDELRRLNGPLDFGADEDALRPIRVRRLAPTLLEFVLREGKNRQIRRVCDGIGLHVVDLLRVRMGKSDLGSLPEGSWRTMSKLETDDFKAP
jgi:23S rRNA pseudouridine2604 synthase